MAHVMAFAPRRRAPRVLDENARLASQTDVLIDAITGAARSELEGLPVSVIYTKLCTHLRAMGLEPAESKVLRIATWISEAGDPGAHAA